MKRLLHAELASRDKLKLVERLQIIRVAANEYKLVSISESLLLKLENAPDGFLDTVLPLLKAGCHLKQVYKSVDESNHAEAFTLINDLFARGLLEKVHFSRSTKLSQSELEIYSEQLKFFSNFQAFGDQPSLSDVTYATGALAMQRKLKDSNVMLLGLGRLGSRLAYALACTGIGNIIGSDPTLVTKNDCIDGRFAPGDLGKVREEILQREIEQVNHNVRFLPFQNNCKFDQGLIELPANLDLLIICEDTFDPELYRAVNRACLKQKVAWTSCRNLGLRFEIGPTVVPHETACFKCFELRKMSNSDSYSEYLSIHQQLTSQHITLGGLNVAFGDSLMVVEVIKLLTTFSRAITYGSMFSFDLISFEAKVHPILKIPRCPDCSRLSHSRPIPHIWQLGKALENT